MRKKIGFLLIMLLLPGGVFFCIYACIIRGMTIQQAASACKGFVKRLLS